MSPWTPGPPIPPPPWGAPHSRDPASPAGSPRVRRVLIVDDVPFYRDQVSSIVRARHWEPFAAASGEEALQIAQRASQNRQPLHAALVDILMPQSRIDGVATARRLIRDHRIPCIMLTSVEDDVVRMQCHLVGASGYLVKDATLSEERIRRAIQAVLDGELDRDLNDTLAPVASHRSQQALQALQRQIVLDQISQLLTPAQQRVAQLMQRGLTNQEIADLLGISVSTVNTHVQEILSRLGVASRRALLPHRIYDSLIDSLSPEG